MTLKTGVMADENSALHHRNKLYIKIGNQYYKFQSYLTTLLFFPQFFYQINTALLSKRGSIKNINNHTDPKL